MVDRLVAVAVRLQNTWFDLRDREDGQGFVEYLTLVALIAIALFAALIFFRDQLGTIFSKITDDIGSNLP
jgi:Flp pilus assembly pilin Flp